MFSLEAQLVAEDPERHRETFSNRFRLMSRPQRAKLLRRLDRALDVLRDIQTRTE